VRGRQGLLGLEGLLATPQAGEAQGVGLDGGGAPTARIYRRAEGPIYGRTWAVRAPAVAAPINAITRRGIGATPEAAIS